jgi:hypothetical protein
LVNQFNFLLKKTTQILEPNGQVASGQKIRQNQPTPFRALAASKLEKAISMEADLPIWRPLAR